MSFASLCAHLNFKIVLCCIDTSVDLNTHGTGGNVTCTWACEIGKVCGKEFSRSDHLSRHMEIHVDKRPFQCSLCDKTFREKYHLQSHKKVVHEKIKDYECDQCRHCGYA